MTKEQAQQAVADIVRNMVGWRPMNEGWERIAPGLRDEIRNEWVRIILEADKKDQSCLPPSSSV